MSYHSIGALITFCLLSSATSWAYTIDFHSHVNPPWFQSLTAQYVAPGAAVAVLNPNWTIEAHLSYMKNNSIDHAVVSFGGEGPNVNGNNVTFAVNVSRQANE